MSFESKSSFKRWILADCVKVFIFLDTFAESESVKIDVNELSKKFHQVDNFSDLSEKMVGLKFYDFFRKFLRSETFCW